LRREKLKTQRENDIPDVYVCNKKIKIWEMEVCVKSKRGIIKSNNNNNKKKKRLDERPEKEKP
jgi:hypothetical protein